MLNFIKRNPAIWFFVLLVIYFFKLNQEFTNAVIPGWHNSFFSFFHHILFFVPWLLIINVVVYFFLSFFKKLLDLKTAFIHFILTAIIILIISLLPLHSILVDVLLSSSSIFVLPITNQITIILYALFDLIHLYFLIYGVYKWRKT